MGEAKRRKKTDPNYGKHLKNGFGSTGNSKRIWNSASDNYFKQGVAFEYKREYQKAISSYSKAIECDPSNSEAYFGRANVYDDTEKYADAIEDYTQHLKLSRGTYRGFNNRGLVYVKLEKAENAISDLENAIKFDNTKPFTYKMLGVLEWEQGNLTKSIQIHKQSSELYLKLNDRSGYQAVIEMLEESNGQLGLIRMILNDYSVSSVDWNEMQSRYEDNPQVDDSNDFKEAQPINIDISNTSENTEFDHYSYGEREEYFKNLDFYLEKGGAFEEGLPKTHKYKSVRDSELFKFIQNSVDNEEKVGDYILSKVRSLSDLTDIHPDLLALVDKSIMSKRDGDLNQAFKYYDQVFNQNQTWFMLWFGLAKLLCLLREYKMAFACIRICTSLYPKMSDGRQYSSDHNLSYHYSQMHSLAMKGGENESYLKSLGRPLNTVRVENSAPRVREKTPLLKVKVIKPDDFI